MKKILNKIKKGDLSTTLVTIIAVFCISMVFFQNIMLNLEVEKYTVINQYARDALLICESDAIIEVKDLNAVYDAMANKILTGENDTMLMKVWLGDNSFEDTANNMKWYIQGGTTNNGATIKPLYAQKINIRIEYNYSSFRIIPMNSKTIQAQRSDTDKSMSVQLSTTSKRRASV